MPDNWWQLCVRMLYVTNQPRRNVQNVLNLGYHERGIVVMIVSKPVGEITNYCINRPKLINDNNNLNRKMVMATIHAMMAMIAVLMAKTMQMRLCRLMH